MTLIKRVIGAIIIALCAAGAVVYNRECAEGIESGIALCLSALIPSLFIFMILTAYIIKSGLDEPTARPFRSLAKLFGLPYESAPAVILGLIGGYPIGASCAAMLHEEGRISESEAEKTAYIAFSAGPGFIINYVGRSIIGLREAGNILLISQLIAVILTGLVVGRTVKCSPPPHRAAASRGGKNAFVSAVAHASRSALAMCAVVIVFCAAARVAQAVLDERAADMMTALLEVSAGCKRLGGRLPLYHTAFIIGFGGLSVHFQVFSALGGIRISRVKYLLFRALEGIFAAVAAYILLMAVPIKTAVFSSAEAPLTAAGSATLIGSGALIAAAVCFVGSVSDRTRRLLYVRNSRLDRQQKGYERL